MTLDIRPAAGALGAEISGVDLRTLGRRIEIDGTRPFYDPAL